MCLSSATLILSILAPFSMKRAGEAFGAISLAATSNTDVSSALILMGMLTVPQSQICSDVPCLVFPAGTI